MDTSTNKDRHTIGEVVYTCLFWTVTVLAPMAMWLVHLMLHIMGIAHTETPMWWF
jgi:hypothetical protein